MKLAPLLVLAALAGACGGGDEQAATQPPKAFAPVDITRPLNGDPVEATTGEDERLEARVTVTGTAEPGSALKVTGSCTEADCLKPVRADASGRFRAKVRLAAAPDQGGANVVVEYDQGDAFDSDRVVVLLQEPAVAAAPDEPRTKRPRAERDEPWSPQAPEDPDATPSPSPSPQPIPEAEPGGPSSGTLVMVGDSLAEGTQPYLGKLLNGWKVTTDARRGRPLAEGMRVFDALSPPDGAVLAFSLFTNDGPGAVGALKAAVRRSVPSSGCAIWATIVRPAVGGQSYAAANRALEQLDAQLDRLVVVPWAQTVRQNPSLLAGDGVHATPAGYRARAALYANAARSC